MYDMTKIIHNAWKIKFIDGTILHIYPVKMKDRNDLSEILKDVEEKEVSLDDLTTIVSKVINNNKERKVYSNEKLKELLDEEEMVDFLSNYTDWLVSKLNEKN